MSPPQARWVALDIETTGPDPERDGVLEVALVRFGPQGPGERWSSLVNPGRSVPRSIALLTGIAEEEARRAPPLAALAGEVIAFAGGDPVVGHSVAFDLHFLARKGIGLANESYDTHELAAVLLPEMASYSLSSLAAHFGIPFPRQHRALPDAEVAGRVFLGLREVAIGLPYELLAEVARLSRWAPSSLGRFFAEPCGQLPESVARPLTSGEDTLLGRAGAVGRRLPALEAAAERVQLDGEALAALLAQGSPLARHLSGFEDRPQQREMARSVAALLNKGGRLVIEAGTGVGKSLAYLLPAALYATANGERVVISTDTINLQEQLIRKDIPALEEAMAGAAPAMLSALARAEPAPALASLAEVRAAVLKGAANYLCLRRLAAVRAAGPSSAAELRLVAKLLVWLQGTETGDVAGLNLTVEEQPLWGRFCAGGAACVPPSCDFYRRSLCLLYRARWKAEAAHLVVVNHALLLSNAAAGGSAVPPFRHLIVDEAHNLEDEATKQLGWRGGTETFARPLERVAELSGLLGRLLRPGLESKEAGNVRMPALLAREAGAAAESAAGAAAAARARVERFFAALAGFARRWCPAAQEERLRVTPALRVQPEWGKLEVEWEDVALALREAGGRAEHLGTLLSRFAGDAPWQDIQLDLSAAAQGIEQELALASEVVSGESKGRVAWVELDPFAGDASLASAPVRVAEELERCLFSRLTSAVFTSATLTVGGSFRHFRQRLGLDVAAELALGSPFDYRASTLLWVVSDLPEPAAPGYQAALAVALGELAEATGGRMLVLFTSHGALQATYFALHDGLVEKGIAVLGQGSRLDGSPRRILGLFRGEARAVLMGTASFWEGVDVVGEALSVLAIARLPFDVPSDPVFAARSEEFEDPFNQCAVPQAALRFKQGFGRLIRSKSDRGIVAIFDSRIARRRYGKVFLDSLPPCTMRMGPARDLPRAAAAWLNPV